MKPKNLSKGLKRELDRLSPDGLEKKNRKKKSKRKKRGKKRRKKERKRRTSEA